MRSLTKSLAITAAAGVMVAPVVAQAGTRAESAPVTVDVQRAGAPVAGESDLSLRNPVWLLLLLATIAAIILALTGRSRG